MNKLLQIDIDRQQPNRIHTDSSGGVRQITDKAQNIAFVADSQSVYDYGGFYQTGTNGSYSASKNIDLSNKDWTIRTRIRIGNTGTSYHRILSNRTSAPNAGFTISLFNTTVSCSFASNSTFYSLISTSGSLPSGLLVDIIFEKVGNTIKCFHTDPTGTSLKHYKSITLANSTIDFNVNAILKLFKDQALTQNNYEFYHLIIESGKRYFDIAGAEGTIVDSNPNPLWNNAITYFKRYKDDGFKKIFLSSRYAENIIADNTSKVERIYSEIGVNNYAEQTNILRQPVLTNKGLLFSRTNTQQLLIDQLPNANNDTSYFVGFWHAPTSTTTTQVIFQLRGDNLTTILAQLMWNHSSNLGNKYTVFADGVLTPDTTVYALNTYNYLAFIFDGTTLYFLVNGILVNSVASPYSSFTNGIDATIGTNRSLVNGCDMYFDELLFSTATEIDPTGYTVGDPVFDPPRRKSFNSEIIQF